MFRERDTAEPPGNMGAAKGQYSTAWTRLEFLPVPDPSGYQIVTCDGTAYWIRTVTDEGNEVGPNSGGVVMKLHKVRA